MKAGLGGIAHFIVQCQWGIRVFDMCSSLGIHNGQVIISVPSCLVDVDNRLGGFQGGSGLTDADKDTDMGLD